MNRGLLAELSRESWAMEPRALEAFLAKVAAIADPPAERASQLLSQMTTGASAPAGECERRLAWAVWVNTSNPGSAAGRLIVAPPAEPASAWFADAPARPRLAKSNGVGTIPISGVLLKRVPNVLRWLGIEATAYAEIEADLKEALADEEVKTIRLAIDSPGGQTAGVKEAADALYAARIKKQILAEIEDLGASAAYWLGSQADRISAGPNAMVGSIGVYTVYVDWSKAAEQEGAKVHVIASGAHKGMGVPGSPITEEQLAAMGQVIDGMAANFRGDVLRGRADHVDEEDEEDMGEMMSGRVWLAKDAARLGLIDAVLGRNSTSAGVRSAADSSSPKGEMDMNEQERAAADKKAREEATAAERKRLTDLKAAFPADPGFAMAQFETGATVEAARAAYSDILTERLAKSERENADLKAKVQARPAVVGAPPVKVGNGGSGEGGVAGSAAPSGFIERAKALAAERECPVRVAMSELARTEPALYQRHLDECAALAPAHAARKREVGVN